MTEALKVKSTPCGSGDSVKFSSLDHAQKILQNLNGLRRDSTFCDIQIKIGSKTFWAHRAMLSASTPYFQAMFTSGLSESNNSEVEIHGIDENVFASLLDFIYTGQIEIKKTNVQDIMIAADMLQLPEIEETCCAFLKKELHFSNCLGIYRFSDMRSCQKLKTIAENFIHSNFLEVIKEDEFLDIPLPILRTIIESDQLHVDQEIQVFDAVMTWIFHDITNRRRFIFQLLEKIRIPLISPIYLKTYTRNCADLSLKIALTKFIEDQVPSSYVQHRACGRKRIFIIGGYNREIGKRWSESCTLNALECFDLPKNQWKSLRPMNIARSGHGVTVLNGLIYAIGGESADSMIFSHGEIYSPADDRWELLPNMINSRTLLGVCAVDGLIYALGGWIGCNLGNSIECFDPETNKWTECGFMVTPRCASGVLSCQGLIYVIGGLSDMLTEMNLVETFNPVTQNWHKLANMKVRRAYVSVVVLHGFLYAVGGVTGVDTALNNVERYSFDDEKWEEVASMHHARGSPCVAAINGCIYVMGGRTSSDEFSPATTLQVIECFTPQTNKWTEVGKMPIGCCESGVAIL